MSHQSKRIIKVNKSLRTYNQMCLSSDLTQVWEQLSTYTSSGMPTLVKNNFRLIYFAEQIQTFNFAAYVS
jgi:hypothetical protein